MKNPKMFLESLGCPKNRVDSEVILSSFLNSGWEITDNESIADLIILNTCSFILPAREESISRFFELNSSRKKGSKICIAGCLPQLYPDLATMIPEADIIVGINDIPRLTEMINENLESEFKKEIQKPQFIVNSTFDRCLTLSPHTAYVKIADGCDNWCTYCSIPNIRGRYRERDPQDIVTEIKNLAKKGVKEIVLISQDTTRYGVNNSSSLAELLELVNNIPLDFKARVMYFYLSRITENLIKKVSKLEKIMPYFEIPIQHVSSEVLEKMNRHYTVSDITKTIDLIKKTCGNNYILRTTFISSFPAEKKKDHEMLMNFIRENHFDYAGAFQYSKEEHTAAYKMRSIPEKTAQQRSDEIEKAVGIMMEKRLDRFVGKKMEILYEGIDPQLKVPVGRGWHQAPEIDGITIITNIETQKPGTYLKCILVAREGVDFIAEVI